MVQVTAKVTGASVTPGITRRPTRPLTCRVPPRVVEPAFSLHVSRQKVFCCIRLLHLSLVSLPSTSTLSIKHRLAENFNPPVASDLD
jgi:hypothetical protein